MKNKKLLMPLAGVAALGAVTPIVMTATSCGEQVDSTISKIEATTTKTDTYVGVTLKRSDIKVTVTYKDATKAPKVVTDWTCDAIGSKGYHFGKAETKTFTIKYHGHKSNITCTASMAGAMVIDTLLAPTLVTTTGYNTEATLHVYGVNVEQTDPHEIDPTYLTVTPSNDNVIYNKETNTLVANKAGDTTITVNIEGITEKAYTATAKVTVVNTTTTITDAKADSEGTGAIVTLGAGDSTTKVCNVPEYVEIGGKHLPVTEITAAATVSNIETLALPATITTINGKFAGSTATDNHLFTIYYDGTTTDWNSIDCDDDWAGYGVTGAWCFGDEEAKFVNFTATHDATYVAKSEEVENPYFTASMGAVVAKGSHTVGFDMVLANAETAAEVAKYQVINIANTGVAAGYLNVDGVYVNGEKWTEGSGQNTYSVDGGRHNTVITLDSTTKLGLDDRVVVTFRSPLITGSVMTVTLEKAEE